MSAQFLKGDGFTLVFTPHFLQRLEERKNIHILEGLDLNRIVEKAEMDTCYAIPNKGMYIYAKKKYHTKRKRVEFELITITQDKKLTTANRNYAILFPLESI
jgi:hypothetical protein